MFNHCSSISVTCCMQWGHTCNIPVFRNIFHLLFILPRRRLVALIAVGTSNIELKETLVPHHIKTAGCHRHEPNRLSLLSSTYKRQIRQLESGLRLLMWQISDGWGETLSIAAHPYIRGPQLRLPCGILTSLFTLRLCVKAKFLIFLSSRRVSFVIRGVKNMFWEGRKSTCLLFGPHACFPHDAPPYDSLFWHKRGCFSASPGLWRLNTRL